MAGEAATLSYDEVEALGFSNIVHAGQYEDPDNMIAESMMAGVPSTDREGRQIISYSQFKRLSKMGHRLDNFAMRMKWPGRQGQRTIQASKYLKWLGAGYIPVGVTEEDLATFSDEMINRYRYDAEMSGNVIKRRKVAPVAEEQGDGVVIYWCKDKYADCTRFFDSSRGLKTHWGRDHGEWSK